MGAEGELHLAGDVVVTRSGQTLARERLIQAVSGALAKRLGPDERIRILSVGLPGEVAAGDADLEVCVPDGPLPSPLTVWVDLVSGGARVGRAWARAEIFRSRPVLTLTRDARRGEVITPEDVEVRTGPSPMGALADPAEAAGKRLVRSMRAGSALTVRDLEAVPLVGRGDPVRLVARVDGIVASTVGRALGSAGVGEVVEVENLASGRTVAGVLGEGAVVNVTAGLGR